MIQQTTFTLRARARGFHLVTDEVLSHLPALPKTGLLNLFIQHTSAGLSVNENCDPDVRSDMEKIFNNLVRERESWYDHTLEGWDDMPAHAKSSLVGASLSIPITDGRLNLGTWQGIYLCEFRNHGGGRRIVATIIPQPRRRTAHRGYHPRRIAQGTGCGMERLRLSAKHFPASPVNTTRDKSTPSAAASEITPLAAILRATSRKCPS